MTLTESLYAAQQKDADEMRLIEVLTASGVPPDEACASVIGGDYRLSDAVKKALAG